MPAKEGHGPMELLTELEEALGTQPEEADSWQKTSANARYFSSNCCGIKTNVGGFNALCGIGENVEVAANVCAEGEGTRP